MPAAKTSSAAAAPAKLTRTEYGKFQESYDYFNERLFAGQLPEVYITLQRHPNTRGYFAAQRFNGRAAKGQQPAAPVHELALNPDTFDGRTDMEILSTLVHEMCHVWQETHGTPPRRCYHNQEWANQMKTVGLQPDDGKGKETGQAVSHTIIPGGAFETACKALLARPFSLDWQSNPAWGKRASSGKKRASKTKYTCPECDANAWGKPDLHLICGDCFDEDIAPTYMEAEPPEGDA